VASKQFTFAVVARGAQSTTFLVNKILAQRRTGASASKPTTINCILGRPRLVLVRRIERICRVQKLRNCSGTNFLSELESIMPELVGYRCDNCGEGFPIERLLPHEQEQARRDGRPLYGIACPKCGSPKVRQVS